VRPEQHYSLGSADRHSLVPETRGDGFPGPSTPHCQHRFHLRPRLETPEPGHQLLRRLHWRRSLDLCQHVRCT